MRKSSHKIKGGPGINVRQIGDFSIISATANGGAKKKNQNASITVGFIGSSEQGGEPPGISVIDALTYDGSIGEDGKIDIYLPFYALNSTDPDRPIIDYGSDGSIDFTLGPQDLSDTQIQNIIDSSKEAVLEELELATDEVSEISITPPGKPDDLRMTIKVNKITNEKMANNAIGTDELIDGKVTDAKLSPQADEEEVKTTDYTKVLYFTPKGRLKRAENHPNPPGPAGITALQGDVVASGPGLATAQIQQEAVERGMIEKKAVDTDQLEDGAVTTIKIDGDSISLAKMKINSVNTDQLVDGAVTMPKIALLSVDTSRMIPTGVTAAKYDYPKSVTVDVSGRVTGIESGTQGGGDINIDSSDFSIGVSEAPAGTFDLIVENVTLDVIDDGGASTGQVMTWSSVQGQWIPAATGIPGGYEEVSLNVCVDGEEETWTVLRKIST